MDPVRIVRQRNILALTGLRGAAAIWVVGYHFNSAASIVSSGYLGVDIFFILSGFILSFVYNSPSDIRAVRSYLSFLVIRLVRIYPLYLVALNMLGIFVLINPDFRAIYEVPEQRWSLGAYLASLLLVQNWAHFLPTCWNTPPGL
jgi:peptidoglycan/LPS O-acetylase OafA/YrhL